jgi:hypothetical protein
MSNMRFHGYTKYNEERFRPPLSKLSQGFFGRMFRKLQPFDPPGRTEADKQKFFADLAAQMIDNNDSGDNERIPAGYTYLGQFIDHDITFDPASSLERLNDPDRLVNFRSPKFDLDSMYGGGPSDDPFLYDNTQFGRLLLGKGRIIDDPGGAQTLSDKPSNEDDLLRNSQGTAIIGDPRNDENLIVSQLQLAFIKFHNAMLDKLAGTSGLTGESLFLFTQRQVRWTYQYIVLHDFLAKRVLTPELVQSKLPARDVGICPRGVRLLFYRYDDSPFMPVEFSVAAYRMGHSMIRDKYVLNEILHGIRNQEPVPIFLPGTAKALEDARGGRPLPQAWSMQWNLFFDVDDSKPQLSRNIDTLLAKALTTLPGFPAGSNVLALRNLLRGWRFGLPSGQAVARAMGITPLPPDRADCDDPLWVYVLKEAAQEAGGQHLGSVGGQIVVEVFVGLLAGDPTSYLNLEPEFEPPIPKSGEQHELADLLKFAGVPITKADLQF